MNFQVLRGLVESIHKTHKCQKCGSSVTEKDIDILGAAGSSINMNVICPKCGKNHIVRAEVNQMDLKGDDVSDLQEMKQQLNKKFGKKIKNGGVGIDIHAVQNDGIQDDDIVSLNKKLKGDDDLSIEDLLK